MGDLSSAAPPPLDAGDHVRGSGDRVVVVYADYECPYCARTDRLLADLGVVQVFRHFPVTSKHRRARALANAAEAASLQGAFWSMHDALFADQSRVDDPHLWERAERLGLDVSRFDRDRRSEAVATRVESDFRAGIRAGVVSTPTLFVDGRRHAGAPTAELVAALAG
ncbi:MAG: hypothetical protein NVSMB25_22400 [Thermoleophilaceae bacterium]